MRNTVHIDNADLKRMIGRLEGMKDKMLEPKVVRRIKVLATKPMQEAIRGLVHNSGRTRRRGNATYVSGNLKLSPRVLPLRKTQLVYLGIRVVKQASGTYGQGNRANAWYGHFVEYGTTGGQGNGRGIRPQFYFKRGVMMSQNKSLQVMEREIKKRFDTFKW